MKALYKTLGFVLVWTTCAAAVAAGASGGKTRADVRAEVLEARASGQLLPAGEVMDPRFEQLVGHGGDVRMARSEPTRPAKTRAEVRQEVLAGRANGWTPPSGEVSLYPPLG